MIKKFFIIISLVFISTFMLSVTAKPIYAAFEPFGDACQGVNDSSVCNDQAKDQSTANNSIYGPNGILTKIVRLMAIAIGVVAVIVIMIAGIRFALSGGDATKVATAKSTILYAVVGLIVAALAQSIVIFVLDKL